MRHTIRFRSRKLAALTPLALFAASTAHANNNDWDNASDIVRDALVIAAIGVPAVQEDWNGALQAGGSLLAAGGVTYALKHTIHENRPDHSDNKSFPSGHTSVSFAAAATLQNRYGWKVGLPAQLAAAFVGLARVEADKHHVHDVIAGAVIGEAAGFLITRQRDSAVKVFPWGDAHGAGVALAARF